MLLSGVVAATAITPIFDRISTRHLEISPKILFPFIAGCWLSLIWAGKEVYAHFPSVGDLSQLITVKSNNIAPLFVIFVVIGLCSIPFLVVGIELGVVLTRNPHETASVLWFLCVPSFLTNLFC